MSERRRVWATLANLLQKVEAKTQTDAAASPAELTNLENEVRKLGKAQFKANTLVETQMAHWEEMVALLQVAQKQNEELAAALQQQQNATLSHQLLQALLPALDSLEQAIASGQSYLSKRDRAAQSPALTPVQATLVSPADRAMLAGWLDGLRLVQERFLAVLEAGGVTPVATVGEPFDPFRHKAVATLAAANGQTPNTIAQEERRGYQTATGVLRYAEVVVYK